ncbi:MAG: type II secretion system protein GspC [Aquisalimonadaceae bacterium]
MRSSAASIRHAPLVVNAVLAGLIGYTAASLFWHAVPADNPPPPPVRMDIRQSGTASASGIGEQLAALRLLGRAAPLNATAQPRIPVDAPETRLNLSLRGLYYSTRQQAALAIIGEGNREETFYRVGDSLPGGVTINAIHADRVILLRNGRHEALKLPEERLDLRAAAPDAAPVDLPDGSASTDDEASTDGDASPDGADAGGNLAETRRELLRDPANFSRHVQIEPHSADGAFIGIRLQPGRDSTLMEQIGLEPGDIVVSIDGTRMSTPQAGIQAMRQIAGSESAELEVIRNGNPQTIHIDMTN